MRVGILGGTFDPVHYGHLLLAENCREQCRLDQVLFLPAAIPPHKQTCQVTDAAKRLDMVRLAITGHDAFAVSEIEIQRGGVTYTVDTLTGLRQQRADDELFFLMGADSLRDLPTWRQAARICELAVPVVIRRGDMPEPDFSVLADLVSADRLETIRRHQVRMPLVEFNSTAIRQAVADGRTIRYQTPRAVEKYIQTHELYKRAAGVESGERPKLG